MTHYGIIHKPLMVRATNSRKDPSKRVAFLGKQLCFFDQNSPMPKAGEDLEILLFRPLYSRYPAGHEYQGQLMRDSIHAILVKPVDPKLHMLVAIDGFACEGTPCRTTARGRETDGTTLFLSEEVHSFSDTHKDGVMWLTPGISGIFCVNHVNPKPGQILEPKLPTNVWVERSDYEQKSGCGVRVEGLTRLEDAAWFKYIRQ